MKSVAAVMLFALIVVSVVLSQTRPIPAPSSTPDTVFKIANIEGGERGRPAIVVNDRVYDLERANSWVKTGAKLPAGAMPATTLELIEKYDQLKPRIYQIANALGSARADFGSTPDSSKFMAPILYPWNLFAVAVNYRAHGEEMNRTLNEDYEMDPPYVFAKSPKAGIIGPRHTVMLPEGRERIDWEIEFAIVMSKKAKSVTREQARDHIFGYGLILDISDRGGLPRKNALFNADWFVSKSRDNFAPMAAYIVPAEFVKDPQDIPLKLWVNDQLMQDSNTRYMVHGVYDLVRFISSIQTMEPGDIVATGTPSGVGNGRKPPVFLKSGDVIRAEIAGIASIRTPVK